MTTKRQDKPGNPAWSGRQGMPLIPGPDHNPDFRSKGPGGAGARKLSSKYGNREGAGGAGARWRQADRQASAIASAPGAGQSRTEAFQAAVWASSLESDTDRAQRRSTR